MILFLNFAPLSFGGGAERWISAVASSLSKDESVEVIQVDHSFSNFYARLVLHRNFDVRVDTSKAPFTQRFISLSSFLPFTKSWTQLRKSIQQTRTIYTRLEINELLILLYFGGYDVIHKTVIGLHSPLEYNSDSITMMGKFHNVVYGSRFIQAVLRDARHVHVLNPDQERKMTKTYQLSNVIRIPNFIDDVSGKMKVTDKKYLNVCFIGELDKRKGADVLLELIKDSPENIRYTIVGDGYLKDSFSTLPKPQVNYVGYLQHDKISVVLESADVLFMPSRAESFSLVSLEALSHGVVVVCSSKISPNTLEDYLVISKQNTIADYLRILERLHADKKDGTLQSRREVVAHEINAKFSKSATIKRLKNELFD